MCGLHSHIGVWSVNLIWKCSEYLKFKCLKYFEFPNLLIFFKNCLCIQGRNKLRTTMSLSPSISFTYILFLVLVLLVSVSPTLKSQSQPQSQSQSHNREKDLSFCEQQFCDQEYPNNYNNYFIPKHLCDVTGKSAVS